ncbi:MAG: hypothetical protein H0V89_12990 [Deltaproteobacteria bacterium]|nr:hypothetical protein [Deltaproteobacteria bacterium]
MNPMPTTATEVLVTRRNQLLAKSLFRQLRAEGLTHEQIIELSGALIDQVSDELRPRDPQ